MAADEFGDSWRVRGGQDSHLVGIVDDRADADGLVVDLDHEEDLVVVAVVRVDADDTPVGGLAVPLVEVEGGVVELGAEHRLGIELDGPGQDARLVGINRPGDQGTHRVAVVEGVGVAVVDLHAGQAVHRMVGPLLDVGEEGHAGTAVHLAEQGGGVTAHVFGDRCLGVDQEAVRLRAGDEQDTVVNSAPTVHEVAGRPVVVGQEDDIDADSPGVAEQLLRRPAGVIRVAGMGVEHAAIVVQAGEGRRWLDGGAEPFDIGAGRREALGGEPFESRPAPNRWLAGRRLLDLAPGGRRGQQAADGSLKPQPHKE